jgi:serine/threonine-protein kinase
MSEPHDDARAQGKTAAPEGTRASQRPPAADPMLGRVIDGRFEVESLLARGGMGSVYKARQIPLGRPCAIKVLSAAIEGEIDPTFQKRFFLEASIAAKLTHPNTVKVFDYGQAEGDIYFIAMELIEGRTLFRAMRDEGPFPEARASHVAQQICRSLREAHGLGVVHRDLKPGNVLLVDRPDERDMVKVLDFGLVKDVSGERTQVTQAGLRMGSPKYMAPEQALGERITPQTDVYSLGVLLFEMLSGRPPFDKKKAAATAIAHVQDPVPSMQSFHASLDVSAAIEAIVYRCLRKDPLERFASMQEVLEALKVAQREAAGDDAPLSARASALPGEPPPPRRASVAPPRMVEAESLEPQAVSARDAPEIEAIAPPLPPPRVEPAASDAQPSGFIEVSTVEQFSRRARSPRPFMLGGIALALLALGAVAATRAGAPGPGPAAPPLASAPALAAAEAAPAPTTREATARARGAADRERARGRDGARGGDEALRRDAVRRAMGLRRGPRRAPALARAARVPVHDRRRRARAGSRRRAPSGRARRAAPDGHAEPHRQGAGRSVQTLALLRRGSARGLRLLRASERLAHGRGGRVDQGDHLRVVHPRRAEDADRARDAAMIGVRRDDEAEIALAELARLAAHIDGGRARCERLLEQVHELLALGERAHEALQPIDVGVLGQVHEARLPLDDQVARARDPRDRLVSEREGPLAQRVELGPLVAEAPHEEVAHLAERAALDDVGEQVVHARELALVDGVVDLDEAVLDRAVREHQDREELPRLGRDEAELLQRAEIGARCAHDRGRARELGEVLAGLAERVVREGVDLGEALRQPALLLGRDGAHLEQHVDEGAEGAIGRDPAGGRVRLLQVARLLEVGEHVANRRGGEIEPVLARQGAAAHGLAGGDELGDDREEDLARAVVQRLVAHGGDR